MLSLLANIYLLSAISTQQMPPVLGLHLPDLTLPDQKFFDHSEGGGDLGPDFVPMAATPLRSKSSDFFPSPIRMALPSFLVSTAIALLL